MRQIRNVRKKDIIAAVEQETMLFKQDISMFYTAIEKAVNNFLLEANESEDVEVRVFDGLYLTSIYTPEREVFRPDLKIQVAVPAGIRVKPRLTHGYKVGIKKIYHNKDGVVNGAK